ncbi:hypothetical protein JCM19045_1340 [Bacillus sp. JCM 19045]|nr:hypothetical protein JCM19045_1340 [Bacillus sp. JCM 19045]
MKLKRIVQISVGLTVAVLIAYGGFKLAQSGLETSVEDLTKKRLMESQQVINLKKWKWS